MRINDWFQKTHLFSTLFICAILGVVTFTLKNNSRGPLIWRVEVSHRHKERPEIPWFTEMTMAFIAPWYRTSGPTSLCDVGFLMRQFTQMKSCLETDTSSLNVTLIIKKLKISTVETTGIWSQHPVCPPLIMRLVRPRSICFSWYSYLQWSSSQLHVVIHLDSRQ